MDSDWDSVRAGIIAVLGCIDDTVGQEDTNGDTELISCHDSTPDRFRCDFLEDLSAFLEFHQRWGPGWEFTYRHVQNDNGRDESNTSTANDAASAHDTEASGSRLEDATNGENATAGNDGGSASDEVGDVTGDEGAEKGPAGQNGRGQRLIACWQMKSFDGSGVRGVRVRQASVLTNEVFHGQNAAHPSGVVTEEDTTKGRKGADEVGPKGDGGL